MIIVGFLAVSASQIKTVYADCGPDTCYCDVTSVSTECVTLTGDCVRADGTLYTCSIDYTYTRTVYSCGGWRYVYYPDTNYCDSTDCSGGYIDNDYSEGCGSSDGGGGSPPSTFSVTFDPASTLRTVYPGFSTSYTVIVTPNNYTGTVTLSGIGACGTNNITCSFLDGNTADLSAGTITKTLRVDTTSSTGINTYTITAMGIDTVPDPDLTNSASATLEVIPRPPNQAICNGTWQSMPGGGNTPSQPVGIQLGSVYSDKIGFVIRGTDNQTYYRTCDFSGNDCSFNNNWTSIGGSPYYSPRTFFGAAWDINNKYSDKTYWSRFLQTSPINTWTNWIYVGTGDEPWGSPYRFNDVKGRTWQLRRNADTTISYACGANVCITPAFDASKSSVSPTTVNVNDNVTIRCDMSVRDADFIAPTFTGASNCVYNGYDVTTALFTCTATQSGTHTVYCNTFPTGQNFCAPSNTAGTLTVVAPNQPPTVPSVTVTEPDYCSSVGAYVNWTYSDPEGNPQSSYQVQIDTQGSSFNPPETDSGKISGSGTSYFASGLAFDITYKARVRVWDSNDNVSAWKDSGSWKTPKHAYPLVDFTYSPSTDIPAKQPVQFTDSTTFYDGGGARAWKWLFKAPSSSPSSTLQNPTYTYDNPGTYDVTETATDKDGYSCLRTKQLNIAQPVPTWKEVSPR